MFAAKHMNIFLTGKTKTGKTTLINKFLEQYKGSIGGFRTIRMKTPIDEYCGIYLVDVTKPELMLTEENRAGHCTKNRQPVSCESVFETLGVEALTFKKMPSLIIMDELGVIENNCMSFQKKVLECLNSSSHVLGVLKKKSSDFINSIRTRKDILILDLDNSNQKENLQKLREYLC